MNAVPTAVLTPCIGVCTLDNKGFCHGCLRSSDEIAGWLQMGEERRRHLMDVVLPVREANFGAPSSTS